MTAVTKEIQRWINQYGNERDALNIALAKLQAVNAWILAQERCPECFGDIQPSEKDAIAKSENGVEYVLHSYYLVCCECGAAWSNIGIELATFGM